jgi:hypothetical protein
VRIPTYIPRDLLKDVDENTIAVLHKLDGNWWLTVWYEREGKRERDDIPLGDHTTLLGLR